MQTQAWLSILKSYFIEVDITYIAHEAADTETVCQYAVALMGGTIAIWMDRLEV